MSRIYCPANWLKTLEQAGESEAACAARHCMIRPPPGGTSLQSARASSPHPDLSTKITSRGRIGRSTSAAAGAATGVVAGSAVAASDGAAPAAGAAELPTALTLSDNSPRGSRCSFAGSSMPRHLRSARRRSSAGSRCGTHFVSRPPARCQVSWLQGLPPALGLQRFWEPVAEPRSQRRVSQLQHRGQTRLWALPALSRLWVQPGPRQPAPPSGNPVRGSTCFSASTAATPCRRRNAGAMGLVVCTALGPDRAALRIGRACERADVVIAITMTAGDGQNATGLNVLII